ncbi:SUKH-4 family immunity protein [Actinomadura alba]|uniref:SUKH-4 family immunity protein n=1 Tax=Actinomadura alba TaxID=406431 RepID=UPI001C9BCF86|nr:SUKH-4 family immunity protein [Actinomadura alba]
MDNEWLERTGLVYGDTDVVDRWDISAVERDVLLQNGLPRFVPPFFEATLQSETEPVMASKNHGMLYKIGWGLGNNIGIAQKGGGVYAADGGVYTADSEELEDDYFVNSSLGHFVKLIHRVGYHQAKVITSSEEDADRALALLRREVVEIDPPAFVEGWWSLVFEQMEHGLM